MAESVMSYGENESVPIGGIVYGDERVPTAAGQPPVAPQAAVAQGAPAPVHVAAAAQPPVDLEQAAPAEAAPQAAAVQQAHVAPPAQQLVRRRGDIRNFFGGV